MTDRRFALAEHLLATKPWELFVMVEMGTDRMHHGFWKYMDPEHRKHEPGGPYEDAILDYYQHVDGLVGRLLDHADDDTAVLVVSDHGAKRMDGGIRVNEWLRREGLLRRSREPSGVCVARRRRGRLVEDDRLGRGRLLRAHLPERQGPRARGHRRRRPTTSACATTWLNGSPRSPTSRADPIGTKVFKPEEVYPEVNGVAPDLIVHFGDLLWRSVGTIGGEDGSTPSRTTPARTTPTTRRTGCSSSPAPASHPPGVWTHTSSTSRRPCSSCSESIHHRRCAGRACCTG